MKLFPLWVMDVRMRPDTLKMRKDTVCGGGGDRQRGDLYFKICILFTAILSSQVKKNIHLYPFCRI